MNNPSVMKKTFLLATIVPTALLLAGCETTGLSAREDHNSYAAMINSVYRETPVVTNHPPVARPMRLAVAQIGEVAPDDSLVNELRKDSSLVANVIALPMPGDAVGNYGYNYSRNQDSKTDSLAEEEESARNLARDSGAQYLLLVGGSVDSFNTENVLSVFDLTIVGGFVVPATHVHMGGKAAGTLIDLDSGHVIFMVNSQEEQSGATPDFFADEKRDEMTLETRTQLLTKLADDVLQKLGDLPAEQTAGR